MENHKKLKEELEEALDNWIDIQNDMVNVSKKISDIFDKIYSTDEFKEGMLLSEIKDLDDKIANSEYVDEVVKLKELKLSYIKLLLKIQDK